jgi:hypothetical protein
VYLLGCFGVSVAVSRGTYLSVLKGHLRHLYLYATQLQYTHKKVVNKQFFPIDMWMNVYRWKSGENGLKDVVEAAHNNIPFQAVINHPFLLPTAVVVSLGWSAGSLGFPSSFTVWILAGVSGFFFTSIPGLRFLGEPERYLEFVFVPSAILVAKGVIAFGSSYRLLTLATVVTGSVMIIAYVVVLSQFESTETDDQAFNDILAQLSDESESIVVLQPTNKGKELSYKTKHKGVWWGGHLGSTPETLDEFNRLHDDTYPFVTEDTGWLADRYDPDFVLFNTDRLKNGVGLEPPETVEPQIRVEPYELYRFNDVIGNMSARSLDEND